MPTRALARRAASLAATAVLALPVLSSLAVGCNDESFNEAVAATAAVRARTRGLKGLGGTRPKGVPPNVERLQPADGYIDVPPSDGQECDVCADGISNCGGPCGGGSSTETTACGGHGQCDCEYGGYQLVGYCGSRPSSEVCSFCPPNSRMADPCGDKCVVDDPTSSPSPDSWLCPDRAPIDCGNGRCCQLETSVCCPGTTMCGNTHKACASLSSEESSRGPGTTSGGGGGCSTSCADVGATPSSLRPGGCCSGGGCMSTCADSCGNAWYEAGGRVFGPCSGADTGCLTNAATAASMNCR